MKLIQAERPFPKGYVVFHLGTVVAEGLTLSEAQRLVSEDRYNRRLHWMPDAGAAMISIEVKDENS